MEKFKVIHFGRKNMKAPYFLESKNGQLKKTGNSRIKRSLGVMVAEGMECKEHVNHVVNKVNRMLGFLKRTFKSRDPFVERTCMCH